MACEAMTRMRLMTLRSAIVTEHGLQRCKMVSIAYPIFHSCSTGTVEKWPQPQRKYKAIFTPEVVVYALRAARVTAFNLSVIAHVLDLVGCDVLLEGGALDARERIWTGSQQSEIERTRIELPRIASQGPEVVWQSSLYTSSQKPSENRQICWRKVRKEIRYLIIDQELNVAFFRLKHQPRNVCKEPCRHNCRASRLYGV